MGLRWQRSAELNHDVRSCKTLCRFLLCKGLPRTQPGVVDCRTHPDMPELCPPLCLVKVA